MADSKFKSFYNNGFKTGTHYYLVSEAGWWVEVDYTSGHQEIRKPWKRNKELSDDLKYQMLQRRIIAEASTDNQDYKLLLSRVDEENWGHIMECTELRGLDLRKWLIETPTNAEFQNSFYNS